MTTTPGGKAPETDLVERIRDRLRSVPRLGPGFRLDGLAVAEDGVVLLEGEVPDIAAKKLALEAVAALPGVAGIADRLHVRPATVMGDEEIRNHVRDALMLDPSFLTLEIRERDAGRWRLLRGAPDKTLGGIDIEVANGIVTLNGRVPGLTTKRLAGAMAWWVPGVRDVINGIEVSPAEEDGPNMIAEAARVILEKNPFIDASQIRIGVRHRTIRLTGILPSDIQREMAARDAWAIFGVDTVIDEIEVRPRAPT